MPSVNRRSLARMGWAAGIILLLQSAVIPPSAGAPTQAPPRTGEAVARQLTFDEEYWDAGVDWAPDGKTLAFHRFWFPPGQRPQVSRGQGTRVQGWPGEWRFGGVWSVDVFGGKLRRLVADGVDPRYSPKGDALAYVRVRRVVVEADRGDHVLVRAAVLWLRTGRSQVVGRGPSVAPVWSPDGRRVCYLGEVDNVSIAFRETDASGHEREVGGKPAWTTANHTGPQYFVCDADGRNTRGLSLPRPLPSPEEGPSYFKMGVEERRGIFIWPGPSVGPWFEGPLFSGEYVPLRAAWSPDGRHLALAQGLEHLQPDTGRSHFAWDRLWLVDADGSSPRLLVAGDIETYGPTLVWDVQWMRSGKALAFSRSNESEGTPDWGFAPYRLGMDPPLSPSDKGYQPPAVLSDRHAYIRGWRWGEQWLKPVPESVVSLLANRGAAGDGDLYMERGARADVPLWSPDGTRIAFVRDGHVWVVDVPRGAGAK